MLTNANQNSEKWSQKAFKGKRKLVSKYMVHSFVNMAQLSKGRAGN